MTYEEAVQKINSRLRFGIKPGLEQIGRLMKELGNPQDRLKFVHVAGTNGKGTTCTLISSILRKAGYRTGLYTSPYVTDFRERFQIDGEMIPQQELMEELDKVYPAVERLAGEGIVITEFELITAIAFQWFSDRDCDVVVLEVGLGGRFDATNIIKPPLAAVITSISLDHTAILGDTVEQIAFEKCGILKPGSSAVLYPDQKPEVIGVVKKIAAERGCKLTIPELSEIRETGTDLYGVDLEYQGMKLRLPFIGAHQEKNALTALTAVRILRERGLDISDQAVQDGFSSARIPARMEIFDGAPLVLLDGGHNPGCAVALADVLRKYLPGRKLVAVMGMMADKDSRTALSILAPLFSAVLTLAPDNPRSLPAEELADRAREFCPDCRAMKDRALALDTARDLAGPKGAVIVCGSFYLAGELRPYLENRSDFPAEKI